MIECVDDVDDGVSAKGYLRFIGNSIKMFVL